MKYGFIILSICTLLWTTASGREAVMEKETEALLKRDRQFSKTAQSDGIEAAFSNFLHGDAKVLPRDGHPGWGKDRVMALLKKHRQESPASVPAWEPIGAGVARSGDLGYTFGKKGETYYGTAWIKDDHDSWTVAFSQGLIPASWTTPPPPKNPPPFPARAKAFVTTDREFSAHSVKHGTAAAFHEYVAENGRALQASGPPLTKKDYARALAEIEEKGLKRENLSILEWFPLFARVSKSGDLGYTHGRYVLTFKDKKGERQQVFGYYMSVWQGEADGSLRFVLDGGNRAPAPGKTDH